MKFSIPNARTGAGWCADPMTNKDVPKRRSLTRTALLWTGIISLVGGLAMVVLGIGGLVSGVTFDSVTIGSGPVGVVFALIGLVIILRVKPSGESGWDTMYSRRPSTLLWTTLAVAILAGLALVAPSLLATLHHR